MPSIKDSDDLGWLPLMGHSSLNLRPRANAGPILIVSALTQKRPVDSFGAVVLIRSVLSAAIYKSGVVLNCNRLAMVNPVPIMLIGSYF